MKRFGAWFAALGVVACLSLAPSVAFAKPTVSITRVDVRPGDDAQHLAHELRGLLADAARHAHFAPGDRKTKIDLSARLLEFSAEERDGVLRIRCAMSGRVAGGHGARSKISFGGSPKDRATLEKQVLKMVADGLVARLAAISRSDAASTR